MRIIKLTLEYDGTNYHGWQSQARGGLATIQGTVERALFDLTGKKANVVASGRTDAGVHALGQVAHFLTLSTIPGEAWAPALNRHLPADIRALFSVEVPPGFHARHCASGKTYKYLILNRRAPTALYRDTSWRVNPPLNLRAMRKAAAFLIGTHDFSAFRGSGCSAKSPVRTIRSARILKKGEFIELWFEADAFLQYMVRNMTGTLVEVGLGRFRPAEVKAMLESRERSQAGRTAPPQGLYLVEVSYKDRRRLRRPAVKNR
jgi:tRNA pseudouridine38-40 synthase